MTPSGGSMLGTLFHRRFLQSAWPLMLFVSCTPLKTSARENPESLASPGGNANTMGLAECVAPTSPVVFTSLAGLSPDAR
ncbi:MAG TPA: hypothetical protein VFQ61_34480, partial [Polyangiaceae bacterium]|nr:hypothetical protein [Polyangiaceae bacterium]